MIDFFYFYQGLNSYKKCNFSFYSENLIYFIVPVMIYYWRTSNEPIMYHWRIDKPIKCY